MWIDTVREMVEERGGVEEVEEDIVSMFVIEFPSAVIARRLALKTNYKTLHAIKY
jgi:uncharacterized protein (DUF1330 family)